MVTEHFANPNLSGCCEMQVFRVCVVRQNVNVFNLYRNPDLANRIFDCLLTSMAAVQAEDARASFLLVGDLNCHHQEWLDLTTTNRHSILTTSRPLSLMICRSAIRLLVLPHLPSG